MIIVYTENEKNLTNVLFEIARIELVITDVNTIVRRQYFGLDQPEEKRTHIDMIDLKILRLLTNNSRIPVADIAKQIPCTYDIALHRLRKLIRTNTVTLQTIPNPYAFGKFPAMIRFSIYNKEAFEHLWNFIKTDEHTLTSFEVTGKWNILALMQYKDAKDLVRWEEQTVRLLKKIPYDYELYRYREQPYFNRLPGSINRSITS